LRATAPGGWTNDEGFAADSCSYTEERLSRGVWVSDDAWVDGEGGTHRRYVSPRRSRGGQYLRRVRRLAAKKRYEFHTCTEPEHR
jgi:hypothetical protein